jgi:lipooligosaccharide transport system permease protein
MMLLCGAIFPATQLPGAVQQVGHFLPLAHSIDLIRPAMLGRPAENVGLHIGALCAYAILPFLLSAVLFRRRLMR